ncbi:hypothetical protein VE02_04460 [Pseudogymnoascus sp. 03VT05]|nr:hypothetical protein VE02_04460 [Pseudogymnoascus sp. 03VT05]
MSSPYRAPQTSSPDTLPTISLYRQSRISQESLSLYPAKTKQRATPTHALTMCRLVSTTHACGCAGRTLLHYCASTPAIRSGLIPQGEEPHSMLTRNCILDMNQGPMTHRIDRVCDVCSQGVNPADLIIWPKEQMKEQMKEQTNEQTKKQTNEERLLSDLWRLVDETRLAEKEGVTEEQKLGKVRRWAEEVRLAQEVSGDGRAEGPSEDGRGPEDLRGGDLADNDVGSIALNDLESMMLPRTSEERSLSGDWSLTADGLAEVEEELAGEERSCSRDWSMTPDGMAEAEEELAEEGRNVSEDWSLTPDGMLDAEEELADTEKSWSIDWTETSSELAEAKKREEEWMSEEDREIAKEYDIMQALEDERYNITLQTYDRILQCCCNNLLYDTVWRENNLFRGSSYGSMSAPVRKKNAMVANIDNTDARDMEASEARADGGAAGVTVTSPGGNDKPLPMAGVLEADRLGAMDRETVIIPAKLVPRTDHEKVLSGMEDVAFIEEVADACREEAEQWMEGGKIYLAVKAAMGDRCVGTYQFVAGQVGVIITNFIIAVIAAALRPLRREQNEIKAEKKLARTQAWIKESGAALVTVWPGDVLEPAVWPEDVWEPTDGGSQADDSGGSNNAQTPLPTLDTPDASQPSNRGRWAGRLRRGGRARGSGGARGSGRARGGGRARGSARARGNTGSPQITDSAAGVAAESVTGGIAEDSKNAESPILPTVSELFEPEVPGNAGVARRRGRPKGSRGRGRGRRGWRGGWTAETSTLPRLVGQSLMHDGPQLDKRNQSIVPKTMVGYLQTTEGATGGVPEDPILPPVLDKSRVSDGSQLGIKNRQNSAKFMGSSTRGAVGGLAEDPILPPALDKSRMHDGSQLGIKNGQSTSGAMKSHLQTTKGVARGFSGTPILPPTLDKSRMYDSSQLGIKNRQSATEGAGGDSAEARILPPTVDKPPMPDTSKLGKRKRENASETIGGHLQTIEGVAEGSAWTRSGKTRRILPPTLDKSLMPDASKLGKRKRENASETIGSHQQTIEGFAEVSANGSKNAEIPLHTDIEIMTRKMKSESLDEWDGSYRSRASSPTTPKRTTRSSSKRPSEVAKLPERSPRSNKKQKKTAKQVCVQDDDDDTEDHGDTTVDLTEGAEEDEETLVGKQLVSVQKEQQRKANILRNEELTRKQEDNRRRERERQVRMKEHRDEMRMKEQQRLEQERQEQAHQEQAHQEQAHQEQAHQEQAHQEQAHQEQEREKQARQFQEREKQAREKQARQEKERQNQERQEKERQARQEKQRQKQEQAHQEKERQKQASQEKERQKLERREQERKKALFQHQESIDMMHKVKQQMDDARLQKERNEAREERDRQLAEEKRVQEEDAAAKRLRQEEEEESDTDEDDEDDEEEDPKTNAEETNSEEDSDSDENSEDDEDEDEKKESEKVKEKVNKNPFLGANVPNVAKPTVDESGCVCLRCLKNLAISPVFSCDFTDNSKKCTRCTNRGRSCIPVPSFALEAARKLFTLQRQHDAADPKIRDVIRVRVKADAEAIANRIRLEESRRRQTRDETYRAILLGQAGIKQTQEEILKLLRASLSRRPANGPASGPANGPANGAGSVASGRGGKGKKGAHKRAQKRAKKNSTSQAPL